MSWQHSRSRGVSPIQLEAKHVQESGNQANGMAERKLSQSLQWTLTILQRQDKRNMFSCLGHMCMIDSLCACSHDEAMLGCTVLEETRLHKQRTSFLPLTEWLWIVIFSMALDLQQQLDRQ